MATEPVITVEQAANIKILTAVMRDCARPGMTFNLSITGPINISILHSASTETPVLIQQGGERLQLKESNR